MLDVFSNAVFDVWSLTASINNRPYQPGLIGSLNLFDPQMLTTTTAMVEVTGERLALVPERPRGAPPTPDVSDGRSVVPMRIPHFPIRTTIFADEVQNVRAFGTDNQLVAVQDVIDRREASLGRKLDVTQEYLRLGAVKGIVITEADRESGAPMTQYSLFDQFNVDPQPVIDWPIIGAGAAGQDAFWSGQLTGLINSLGRLMAENISGGMYQTIFGVAGSVAFDAFTMHPETRAPYLALNAAPLTGNMLGSSFTFRGVTIAEYRGKIGNIEFVKPDEIHFFPVGVPGLFIEPYAPANYSDAVNTIALPRYSKMQPLDFDKGVEIEAQMNVAPICTAPRALFTVKVSNAPPPTALAARAPLAA